MSIPSITLDVNFSERAEVRAEESRGPGVADRWPWVGRKLSIFVVPRGGQEHIP